MTRHSPEQVVAKLRQAARRVRGRNARSVLPAKMKGSEMRRPLAAVSVGG